MTKEELKQKLKDIEKKLKSVKKNYWYDTDAIMKWTNERDLILFKLKNLSWY